MFYWKKKKIGRNSFQNAKWSGWRRYRKSYVDGHEDCGDALPASSASSRHLSWWSGSSFSTIGLPSKLSKATKPERSCAFSGQDGAADDDRPAGRRPAAGRLDAGGRAGWTQRRSPIQLGSVSFVCRDRTQNASAVTSGSCGSSVICTCAGRTPFKSPPAAGLCSGQVACLFTSCHCDLISVKIVWFWPTSNKT